MSSVLAVVAHPDDIEFVMAGTLLLLADRGWKVHYFNIANGCCGSMTLDRQQIAEVRLRESQASAAKIPATFYPPICNDLSIFYDEDTLAKVCQVVRQANPSILLTHAPIDYMEDHQNTCRLAVTAAFAKNMPNFVPDSVPRKVEGDIAVYHAQPHGNQTPTGEWVVPQFVVRIDSVMDRKAEMLHCHKSQQGWLDSTQKMSYYTKTMMDLGRTVGELKGLAGFFEGWRQRNPLGFGPAGWDPLRDALSPLCG